MTIIKITIKGGFHMYVKLQDLSTVRWGFINIDNLQAIEMSEEEYNQIPCDNWFYEHFISSKVTNKKGE